MSTERMPCCGALTKVYADAGHRVHAPSCKLAQDKGQPTAETLSAGPDYPVPPPIDDDPLAAALYEHRYGSALARSDGGYAALCRCARQTDPVETEPGVWDWSAVTYTGWVGPVRTPYDPRGMRQDHARHQADMVRVALHDRVEDSLDDIRADLPLRGYGDLPRSVIGRVLDRFIELLAGKDG